MLRQTYVGRNIFSMPPELENHVSRKRLIVKDAIIGHLVKLSKKWSIIMVMS